MRVVAEIKNPAARQRCGVFWYGGEGVPLPPIASLVWTAWSLCALGAIGKYRLRSCGALPICKFAKRRTSLFMLMFESGSAGTSMSSSIGGRSPVSWRLPSDKVRDVTGTPATELALPTARAQRSRCRDCFYLWGTHGCMSSVFLLYVDILGCSAAVRENGEDQRLLEEVKLTAYSG